MYSVSAIVSLSSGLRVGTNIKVIGFSYRRLRVRYVALRTLHQQPFSALFDQARQGLPNKHQERRNDDDGGSNPVGPIESRDLALEIPARSSFPVSLAASTMQIQVDASKMKLQPIPSFRHDRNLCPLRSLRNQTPGKSGHG
jgi:hypothetical protein